jgi:predicted DNA-binding transcriptional regulator AlpA
MRSSTPVEDDYGHTLSLEQTCKVLGISRTTGKRRMVAGTFPIPALPRTGQEPYRFPARRIDQYLARAMETARPRPRRAS